MTECVAIQNEYAYSRLRWQCRRGMLELDLLLQNYLEQRYHGMSEQDKAQFATLLDHADQTLREWFLGQTSPVDAKARAMVQEIRQAAH